jgi:cytosine/adenosine deaminase-related metal-dependent hydrolase
VHDLVIRNGLVVDGTGAPPFHADVAVEGDRIIDVGADLAPARREVDADGHLVTPGFVDIHTHFDGQATWDPVLAPSSQVVCRSPWCADTSGHGTTRRRWRRCCATRVAICSADGRR